MKLSPELKNLYDSYYNNEKKFHLKLKRDLTAIQSVKNIQSLLPKNHFNSILDIGAGDGNTLEVLVNENMADSFSAIEISESGINEIKNKNIQKLLKVEMFDGYKINETDNYYELGVVFHVLEHVEHERLFLNEINRVCQMIYIEVPLENTFFIKNAVKVSQLYGHINFYNPDTLKALMINSNLEILNFGLFSHSKNYEILISGKVTGLFKYIIKKVALKLFPNYATFFFTYTGGILVSKKQ